MRGGARSAGAAGHGTRMARPRTRPAEGSNHPDRLRRVVADPVPADRTLPAMRLAVCSSKGGVGKTTTAANLAVALARSGRVLAVDVDPQESLGRAFGVVAKGRYDSLAALVEDPTEEARGMIRFDVAPGLDLLPAHPSLETAAIHLPTTGGLTTTLRRVLPPWRRPPGPPPAPAPPSSRCAPTTTTSSSTPGATCPGSPSPPSPPPTRC